MCLPRRGRGSKNPGLTDFQSRNGSGASPSSLKSSKLSKSTCSTISNDSQKSLIDAPLIPGFVVTKNRSVIVWHFPYHISQSRLAGRETPSSACSIICVSLAEIIFRNGIKMPTWENEIFIDNDSKDIISSKKKEKYLLPSRIYFAMINAMIDGNHICDPVIEKQKSDLFNIPTALEMTKNQMAEVAFVTSKDNIGNAFLLVYSAIKSVIKHELTSSWNQLFFLLLLVERCVLIIYQKETDTIVVLDSHTHKEIGAMVILGSVKNLAYFCEYFLIRLFPEACHLKPYQLKFEMSLIHFRGSIHEKDCPLNIDEIQQNNLIAAIPRSLRNQIFSQMEKYMREHAKTILPKITTKQQICKKKKVKINN
uniref:Uncharacterized protein n=1 Tax=Panagrolaimus sp. JU765 TaxID=591449 RepID=A0AC34RSZ4_9BILA